MNLQQGLPKFSASIAILLICGLLGACQRSPQFRREEGFNPSSQEIGSRRYETMGQPKKRVFVLSFWNDTPVKPSDVGIFAADELKRGLFLSQRMIVPTDVQTNFGTEDFVQSDHVKVAQLIREGRRLGVAVLVIGRISKIVFRQKGDDVGVFRQKQSLAAVEIETKLFDVQGGREILATSRTGETSTSATVAFEDKDLEGPAYRAELTRLAAREAVAKIIPDAMRAIEKLIWQGRIAKVIATKYFINAGQASGLITGDILRVTSPGDDIYDPVTGAYLGRSPGKLKGTLEVSDFIGPDGASSEIHTGGNFKEGDLVQLY